MDTAAAKTATRSRKRDFEAKLLAAWRELELLYREAQRVITEGRKREPRDSEGRKVEKIKLSLRTSESGSSKTTTEKGISGSPKSAERKRKFSEVDAQSGGFASVSEEEEGQEVFEPPTLSFEDYLTYDQPQKKKKVHNPSLSAGEEDQWHSPCLLCHPSPNSSCASQQSPRRTSEKRAAQEPPEAPQPKRILLEDDIELPDSPLPPIQASCSPLPTVEDIICSQNMTALASPVEDTEEGFGGRRLYSKTPVFAGSRTVQRVPKTLTPAQQSVPDRNNNVGGQVAKTIFLESLPTAPRDVGRKPDTAGTGGALLPQKTIRQPVLATAPKSHPHVSKEKGGDGPTNSRGRPVPSLGRTMFSSWFPEPKKPTGKKTAPLMAKSIQDYKKRFSRR